MRQVSALPPTQPGARLDPPHALPAREDGLDMDASASQTGLSPTAEPVPVSSADAASIPSANGPDLWRAVLSQMPAGSVIAGGAVRDYLLGIEPKDIDVFTDVAAEMPVATRRDGDVVAVDPRFGLYRIDNEHERFEEYAALSNIACISSGQLFGRRVDAVVMEGMVSGADLVAGFDFAINRSWFDGEIHDTPEAAQDRATRTVSLLLTDRLERSVMRFARLHARWGGGWAFKLSASAMSVRQDQDPQGLEAKPASAAPAGGDAQPSDLSEQSS